MKKQFVAALFASTFLLAVGAAVPQAYAAEAVKNSGDDIGGTVTSAKGPEAGVWVVAETKDLPTRFI